MGWRSERVEMSAGRLVAVAVGAAVTLSLVVHSIALLGLAVLGASVPDGLIWAVLILFLFGLGFRTVLGLAHFVRRRRRLRRMRIRR